MPIFSRLKIAFIHIPKTAGTSIVKALEEVDGSKALLTGHQERHDGQIPQHFSFQKLRAMNLLPDDHTVFTVVRHPYDRFLSEYVWRKHICKQPTGTMDQFAVDLFNQNVLPYYCDCWEGHDRLQSYFLEGGFDQVEQLRFETIEQDFLQKFLIRLPKENVTYPKSQYTLTEFAKRQVNLHWKEDFQQFNYAMGV